MNEIPHPGFDKPEEYETYTTTNSVAEERAMEAYPDMTFPFTPLDLNAYRRGAFIQGYEQAEKDLALTIEDVITIIQIIMTSDWYDFEISDKLWSKEFYEEVLKRFKEAKR